MALEQTDWYYDYAEDPELTIRLRRDRLARIGPNTDDAGAWENGYARLWLDDPAQPGTYYRRIIGTPTLNTPAQRAEQVNSWQELTPGEKRQVITGEIDAQIFQAGGTQLVEDPLAARAVESTSGGAAARRSDLEDTEDGDLDGFDPTIVPTPLDGSGFVEAKYTTFVDILDPWVGAPDNVYGIVVWLEVLTETGDEGTAARAHLFGSDEVADDSVLPLTRDPGNPKLWRTESEHGRKWSNKDSVARVRLLWSNGSIPVDNTRELQGYGDRQSSVVRQGGA